MLNHRDGNESEGNLDSFPPLVDDAIVLTGPTAAGKSSVAMALADRIGGEIISLDSIAVYRGMDIGTAKPSAADRKRVPHHLIDLVEPTAEFSVACYLREAHAKVLEIHQRGRAVIFVGGTPMFLKGILRGFDPGPPADWEFRNAVESDVLAYGVDALRERLRQVDPLAEHRIGPNDTRRMIRALEVARQTGTPISHRQVQFDRARDGSACNVFSLMWPRDQLHARINRRVAEMFESGLINEVRGLVDRYGGLSRTASQAVGYREVLQWLSGETSKDLLVAEVGAHTRQLARRQETWFRSFREIRSVPVEEPLQAEAVADRIEQMLTPLRSQSG
jgi:tRNA dimethylallyltransferase